MSGTSTGVWMLARISPSAIQAPIVYAAWYTVNNITTNQAFGLPSQMPNLAVEYHVSSSFSGSSASSIVFSLGSNAPIGTYIWIYGSIPYMTTTPVFSCSSMCVDFVQYGTYSGASRSLGTVAGTFQNTGGSGAIFEISNGGAFSATSGANFAVYKLFSLS